jgi:hypothetical protein
MHQSEYEHKRKFPGVQGALSPTDCDRLYLVRRRAESDQALVDKILNGQYLLIHGHRMCGKSTRARQLIEHNQKLFRGI